MEMQDDTWDFIPVSWEECLAVDADFDDTEDKDLCCWDAYTRRLGLD